MRLKWASVKGEAVGAGWQVRRADEALQAERRGGAAEDVLASWKEDNSHVGVRTVPLRHVLRASINTFLDISVSPNSLSLFFGPTLCQCSQPLFQTVIEPQMTACF